MVLRGPRGRLAMVAALALASAPACRGKRGRDPATDGPRADAALAPGRALTAERRARLAALAVAPYQVAVMSEGPTDVALAVSDAAQRVTLTAAACLRCTPTTVAAWEAQRPSLAALWAPGAVAVPPLAGAGLTIAAISIGDRDAITLDARRGVDAPAGYFIHWNDGVTQLQASCESGPPAADAPSPCAPIAIAAMTAAVAALR